MKVANNKADYCGIDVSKQSFDVYYQGNSYVFNNAVEGFIKLKKLINLGQTCCVMEATGPYYLSLAVFLHSHAVKVCVINPLVIKRFSQMKMIRAKTDKADAKLIALFAEKEEPKFWTPPHSILHEIQQIQTVMDGLLKQRRMMKNQLEAIAVQPFQSKETIQTLQDLINHVNERLIILEQKSILQVEAHFSKELDLMTSIPGIGVKTAMALLVTTHGFSRFGNSKQLASYAGICPRIYQSGTSIKGKGHITKMGGSRLRSVLYLASWSAIKYNKACKALYERLLANGKAKKLALIAVANKLLKQAFAVVTNQEFYNETKYYSELKHTLT